MKMDRMHVNRNKRSRDTLKMAGDKAGSIQNNKQKRIGNAPVREASRAAGAG